MNIMDVVRAADTGLPLYTVEGKSEMELIESFFDSMRLPRPSRECCYTTTDEGSIVFVNGYGCTIRLTPHARRPLFDSPHFLKPIFEKSSANIHVAIMPGVDSPVCFEDMLKIQKLLKKQENINIADGDAHIDNFGYIPGTRFPVMLDVDSGYVKKAVMAEACKELWNKIAPVRDLLQKQHKLRKKYGFDAVDPQGDKYKDLRNIIHQAWPDDAQTPDPDGVRKFWDACRIARQNGNLVETWRKSGELSRISGAYEKLMMGSTPHL